MTREEIHEPASERGATATSLPFEYEDRTDRRYVRALEEVRAAWLWTQSRRARGLLPS